MALKKGVCKNYGNCPLADNEEIQEVDSSEFFCKYDGKPLYEITPPPPPPKWIYFVIAAIVLIGGGIGAYFGFFRKEPSIIVSLSLNKEVITLEPGNCDTLKASVFTTPENSYANVSVLYTSEDANVAHVNNTGVVRAVSKGETTVTVIARSPNGFADTAYAKVTVRDRTDTLPETISLNKEIINFNVGECDTLVVNVAVYPSDANVLVSFTSDNADVAQVDGLGIVKAIAKGETTINVIARTKNGFEDTANVMVTVSENEKAVDKQNKVRKKISSQISFGTLDGSIEYDNDATIKVTRQHTIKLKDAKQSIVTLYPGDVLKPCRIRKGVLESFQIIRQNGNRQSVIDSQEKLN